MPNSSSWRNGPVGDEFSTNPLSPKYGTHDWIAEHALDWLPLTEKKYILDNLATYLYGTELPDKTSGPDAIGDMDKHHFYFNETGIIKDDSAGVRTAQEYYTAVSYFEAGDLINGVLHLGIMTHYIADLAVFGYVMNATYWGTPTNHTNYMDYVESKIDSYNSPEFDNYLQFDGRLFNLPPEDAANAMAYNTTFDAIGISTRAIEMGRENCTWMDANYNWLNPDFKNRCGESLNYATNIIADVLHTLYDFNITAPEPPQNLKVGEVKGYSINLTWDANTEEDLGGYSIFINKTGSTTEFIEEPINVSAGTTSFSYPGLVDETTYYFMLKAFDVVGKLSDPSAIVSATTSDVTKPPIPLVFDLIDITDKPKLTVIGRSLEPGAKIEVFLNSGLDPAGINYSSVEFDGLFWVKITLVEGVNNITVRAVDASGNRGDFSPYQIVLLDTIMPYADAGSNINVELGKTPVSVQFDGDNSTDNLGVIANYTWTLDYQYNIYYLYGVSPSFYFDEAGDYRIQLNVTDQIDNWNIDYVWVNVTQLDVIPPYIISRSPDVDAINQSINVTINVRFNEPLDINSLSIQLFSNIEGEVQIPKPTYVPLQGLELKPFRNLTHSRTYTVIITAQDLAGNELTGGTWSFSTILRPVDFDDDNIPDAWEWSYGLDANSSDSWSDPDDDGLSNFEEYNFGVNSTDPTKSDTDGDQLPDGWERSYGLDPLDSSGDNGADGDPDDDQKTNYEEYTAGTNPKEKPEPTGDGNGKTSDDYTIYLVVLIIIIIVLIILVLLARKVRYKATGVETKEDDQYLEGSDASELGVGGNLLFEDTNGYKTVEETLKPEEQRSINVAGAAMKSSDTSGTTDSEESSGKPTPAEILARAKLEERKCPKCGAGLPEDTTYCFECGAILEEKSE